MRYKIVFICPFDLNWKRGTPYRARTIINRISEKFDVLILSMGGFNKNNIDLSYKIPKNALFKTIFMWIHMIKILLLQRPVAVHCFTTTAILPGLIYKFFNRKTKVIFEMHGISELELRNTNIIRRIFYTMIDKIGCKYSDVIIVMSYPMKKFVISNYGASHSKVHVIWGPINLDIIPYNKLKIRKKFIVGYGGNDSFWQGFDTIIKAAELLKEYKDIQFYIVGVPKGKYPNMDNVCFFGKIKGDIEYFMKISECSVLLSTRIGDPVANLQYPQKLSAYLAVGRPIIATDVSDVKTIIEKAMCGTVIEPENAELLAKTILDYYNAYKKCPQKLMVEGDNARKFAERNLSDRIIEEKLSNIYLK